MDPVELSQKLIRCPSITPQNEGALEILEQALKQLGFTCERLDFQGIGNLYAYRGSGHPHFCFAGHTDVVALGDPSLWTHPPFQGEIINGQLWGRGAADMKCAIACFIGALSSFLNGQPYKGKISLLITGDEEGEALHGTQYVLPLLVERNDTPDFCLIGEPTSVDKVGDTLKIGRRGSITGKLSCFGKQGHIAYPQHADNPIPRLLNCFKALYDHSFDKGTDDFESTRFEVTSIDVGNSVTNIIPHKVEGRFGLRFNTLQNPEDLCNFIRLACQKYAGEHHLQLTIHGNAFLTKDQEKIALIQKAIQRVMGYVPSLNTSGGTTDGRFISCYCSVIECGMREFTMHQIDEHVALEDIKILTRIYGSILTAFFN